MLFSYAFYCTHYNCISAFYFLLALYGTYSQALYEELLQERVQ